MLNRVLYSRTFDLATGTYGTVSPDFTEPPKRKKGKYIHVSVKKRSQLCIEFGNSFFLDEFLKKVGFYPVIDAVGYGNLDTLRTIIFYYLLGQQANSHAADWYELNYTKNLFPNAAVSSQRISEALAEIGTEESKMAFFAAYYAFVKNRSRVRSYKQPQRHGQRGDPPDLRGAAKHGVPTVLQLHCWKYGRCVHDKTRCLAP